LASKAIAKENVIENKQSKNAYLVVFSLIIIAISVFTYLQVTQEDRLPIRQINISGSFENIDPVQLKRIIDEDVKGNFFTLDVERLYDRLMAQEWVRQVWIHRVWPDKLNIDMHEQVPVAYVAKQGLLNAEGEIFTSNIAAYRGKLPEFEVTDRYYKQAIDAYIHLNNTIAGFDFSIKGFVFDGRKSQTIKLSNGVDIVLGRFDIENRFNRFIKAFGDKVEQQQNEIKRIDLRFTNGFAVSELSPMTSMRIKKVFWV